MIKIGSSKKDFAINLPTHLKEITPEYLNKITEHIKLAENYALVALVLTAKLSEYCYTINSPKGKEPQIGVTPLLIKYNASADVHVDFAPGDVVVISNTDLERGHHFNINSAISSNYVAAYLMEDEDLRKNIQIGNLKDLTGARIGDYYVKMIQCKIVPINDIHGSYTKVESIEDPFVVKVETPTED